MSSSMVVHDRKRTLNGHVNSRYHEFLSLNANSRVFVKMINQRTCSWKTCYSRLQIFLLESCL